MKRIITFIAAFTLSLSVTAQTQLINGGFENWESVGGGGTEPVQWNSFLTADGSLTGQAANQVSSSTDVRPGSTGTKSAKIWSRAVLGIKANGNLTTGRVNMGSISPSNAANHNATVRSNGAFNHPFTYSTKPDSLVFWAKFTSPGAGNKARVAATIHGDVDYRDPAISSQSGQIVATAIHDYGITNGWKRIAVPFVYTSNTIDPRYILISFSTSNTPGGGTGDDVVFIDDVEVIYPPIITARNDNYSINESTPLEFLAAGNSIYDNDEVQFGTLKTTFHPSHIVQSPANGDILFINNKYVYMPRQGFFGEDIFRYRAYDTDSISFGEALVRVTVNYVPPAGATNIVAVSDLAVFYPGVSTDVNVLANDVLVAGTQFDYTKFTIEEAPHKGTAVISQVDNVYKLIYTSNQGATGNDSLTYKICDNQTPFTCSEAKLRITFDFTSVENTTFSDLVMYSNLDKLFFKGSDLEGASFRAYTVTGAMVAEGEVLPVVDFQVNAGVYLIHIVGANGQTTKRLLKQ